MANKKHSHQNPHNCAVNAYLYQEQIRRAMAEEVEKMRQDFQRQLDEKAADNWYRCLAEAGLQYNEDYGSASKVNKSMERLAARMERDRCKTTAELVAELERATGIILEVAE